MQGIGLSQQGQVGLGEAAGKARGRSPIGLLQRPGQGALDQARELLARVAGGARQVAPDQTLVRPAQRAVAEPAQHRLDVPVTLFVLAASSKLDLRRCLKKPAHLRQRHQPLLAHVDHHAPDDRSARYASDSYLGGNTPQRSDSYHVGKD